MERDSTRIQDLSRLGLLCIFFEFFFGLCLGAWSIAMNFHLSACGVAESQIGVLLCFGYLVTAVTSFFVGRVGDKYGFPLVAGVGGLMAGGALLLIANVHQLPLLYLGHGVYSAGLACIVSMEFNLPLSLVKESQRQYSYNLVLVFYFLGSIVGNFLCSVWLPVFPGENPYRYILMICAGMYLLQGIVRGRMPRQYPAVQRREGEEAQPGVWKLLGSGKVRSYLVYGVLTFGLLTLSTEMLNLVLRLWHRMSDSIIGAAFSANSMAGCLVLMLLPAVVRRVSLHRISCVAMAVQCLALLTMAFAPGGLFVAMMLTRTVSCNVLYTSVDSPMLQSMPPQIRGTYAGMRVFSNYAGRSVASAVSGWFVDSGSFQGLFLLCAGVALTQSIVYRVFCRPFMAQGEKGRQ